MNRKSVSENERFEYQQLSIESQRLEAIGKTMYDHRTDLQIRCLQNTIRKEYASGSILHRGFYCPSPVYDIINGNTKRGKLLKKTFVNSKPSTSMVLMSTVIFYTASVSTTPLFQQSIWIIVQTPFTACC